MNELSYPTVLPDPKIGNHERITRGSGPPKSPTIPHVVERAARNGERQPRSIAGKKKTAATELLPLRQLPKEPAKRERATDDSPEALPPLSLDRDPAGGEEAPRDTIPGASRDPPPPPSTPDHLKGGKEKRQKSQFAKLPKEFPRGEEANGAGGR